MVVIGDVFLVIAYIFGVCLSTWALVMGMSFLFPSKVSAAELAADKRPWKTLGLGFVVFAAGLLVSLAFLSQPVPGAKLLGTVLLLALLCVALLGFTGIAGLVGQRIRPLDPDLSRYKAMSRSTGLLVVAGLLPFIGWFVFAPLLLAYGTGLGLQALFARKQAAPAFDFGAA